MCCLTAGPRIPLAAVRPRPLQRLEPANRCQVVGRERIPSAHPRWRRAAQPTHPREPRRARRHPRNARHNALPRVRLPRRPHDVSRLREEQVAERGASERCAQGVILVEAVEDQGEAAAVLENGERGAGERVHLRLSTAAPTASRQYVRFFPLLFHHRAIHTCMHRHPRRRRAPGRGP